MKNIFLLLFFGIFTDTNRTLIVDLSNPTSTINRPSNATNTSDNTPDINITMVDNFDPTIAYTIYVNDVGNATGTVSNNTATNITLGQQTDGLKKIVAEAEDDSGRKVNSTSTFSYVTTDSNTAPKWANNSTSGSAPGTSILHSVNWTDDTELSGYIFEFDNGTDSFTNDTFITFTGTQNWSNVTKYINETIGSTIRWRVYSNDSSNNINSTSIFSYVTTASAPANCWINDEVGKMLIIPTDCYYYGDSGI